jgi:acid phosphatase (class A)
MRQSLLRRGSTAALMLAASLAAGLSMQPPGARAQTAAAPAPARPPKTLKVLTAAEVDPSRILPPPPADGADLQRADLADLQRVYKTRSPERYAQAQWDDKHEDPSIFNAAIGDGFDLTKLPATAKLLAMVDNEQSVAANMAKRYFLRNRPWAIDTSIVACDYKAGAAPLTSYPSGHATLAYSVGFVLADLLPEKSQAIMTRAADYSYSREVCGAHYRSDIEASHTLGTVVAMRMLDNAALKPQIDAARAELRAAHLTAR